MAPSKKMEPDNRIPTAYYRCKRCKDLWTLDEMYLASGAGKDGYYCDQCKEALEQEVELNHIVFCRAIDTPEGKDIMKQRLEPDPNT